MDIFKSECLIRSLINEYLGKNTYTFDWMPLNIDSDIIGLCHYEYRILFFNDQFIENNDEEDVKKVILHEIAHVLAGQEAGHGIEFRKKCCLIGLIDEKYMGEIVDMRLK